jgi:hypothetical protein
MHLQKGISIKTWEKKKLFFVGVLKVTDEKAGAGSVSRRYGSEDPEHWKKRLRDPDPERPMNYGSASVTLLKSSVR